MARCLKFIPISCMGPKDAPKDQRFDFSTNLYPPEHVHVVQIWILQINALKTHLMHKNVQTNTEKSQKITQHSYCSMLTREKIWKQLESMDIVSSPKLGRSVPKPSCFLLEALVCDSLYPNLPQMGQKLYHGMLMPLHDSMPCFLNFRRVLDILEFKNQASQYLRPSYGGTVLDIHSHFLHGT